MPWAWDLDCLVALGKNEDEGSYHVRLRAEVPSAHPTPVQAMVDLVRAYTHVDTCVL